MNLHEYQAKNLLRKFGVPILNGQIAYTPREAQKAAVNLGTPVCVVKAQVHAGGRGKAGGVKVVKGSEQAYEAASKILGMTLVTPQTGAKGKFVSKVLVEAGANIAREYYLSVIMDRENKCVSFIASLEGGMEIEEVAEHQPEKILTVQVKIESGLQDFHCRKIGFFLGLDKNKLPKFSKLVHQLYTAFNALDCSLLEINPLIETAEGEFICLDCKMAIDSNALFRQKEAHAYMDYDEIDERELKAAEVGFSYVGLDGNIGCMVNGAGLAMATMDIIKQYGGEPANFLDVGGGATPETVTEAFKIILKDPAVKGILVNIFGGIMRCDYIAEGVINAAKSLDIKVPLVVRLKGAKFEEGKQMLQNSGLKIVPAESMGEAAEKIVSLVNG